jgi:hypothetical protein
VTDHVMGPPPDYRPLRGEPNDLIPPEERQAIYARGRELVNAAMDAAGIPRHGRDHTTTLTAALADVRRRRAGRGENDENEERNR